MRAFPYQSLYNQANTPPWDRLTSATDYRVQMRALWTSGVGPDSGWAVTPGAGMTVLVSPGYGVVDSEFVYDENTTSGGLATESRTLIVQAAHESLDRIDRVVVRHNDDTTVRATDWYVLEGTPSASPVAPELTRNDSVYELCVAELFIARATNSISSQRITDTRLDYDLCGLSTTKLMDKSLDEIKELLRAAIDDTVAGNLQNQINEIGLKIYPVGSIYMSVNSAEPSTLFGGTWARIKDAFLLSAGDIYDAGTTGGEATHTLTTEEMPQHRHASGTGYSSSTVPDYFGGSTANYGIRSGDKTDASVIWSDYEGNNVAHNNLPPYLAVYVWQRTA